MSNWDRNSTLVMIPKTKNLHYQRIQGRIDELRVSTKNPIIIEALNFIEEHDEAIAAFYLDDLERQEQDSKKE